MSDTETAAEQRTTRSNFASRMLTKELNVRMKTTQENKIKPSDAAQFATNQEAETKESVKVS